MSSERGSVVAFFLFPMELRRIGIVLLVVLWLAAAFQVVYVSRLVNSLNTGGGGGGGGNHADDGAALAAIAAALQRSEVRHDFREE